MVAGVLEAEEAARAEPWLRRSLAAQAGRAFLWAPVALVLGIWTYFGLAAEPSWLVAAPLGIAGAGLLLMRRGSGPLLLAGLLVLGFVLAKARTDWVATPLLHASTGPVAISGTVEDVSPSGKRRVLIIAPSEIEGMLAGAVPRLLRLTALASQGAPQLGDHITTAARLAPLPGPVMPGGFDYGRQLYFEGIGGTGRVTAPIAATPALPGVRLRLAAFLEMTRNAINARIDKVLQGDTAAFAAALIDGERGTIPRVLNLSFQVSGLAHVLSISGLHMSLVAGGVFWLVRALLALIPSLALRYPVKKWAAVAALAAGLFYMLLAGAEVATQRSYIMIAVVFFAILVDRPALSLRNLAFAALVILVIEPEAAIEASFQMSFLAVLGLAAFFEAWASWRSGRDGERREAQGPWRRAATKLAGIAAASLATTLVAGAMSSIPAAYHFGRIAPYGMLANGLAIPVVSFIVMPMALAAALLMPLGLEHWPLWLMGQGLDLTIAISDWVATLPGARMVVPQPAPVAAMLESFGAVLLCLLAGRVRLAGAVVVALGIALGSLHGFPDVLVGRTGANVAIRDAAGNLVPASPRKDRFAVSKWLTANGEEQSPAEAGKRPGWRCAGGLCQAVVQGKSLLYATGDATLADACAGVDILIADFPLRRQCTGVATRIDRFDLWRNGAHALTLAASGIGMATARGAQGERPWTVIPEPRKARYKRP